MYQWSCIVLGLDTHHASRVILVELIRHYIPSVLLSYPSFLT